MDPRTMSPGTDRWLTDSRVYNLIWLGRWVERAQNVARMLLWAAEHEATNNLDDVLGVAADMHGITVAADDSALEVLLTRDSGGSLRGCLEAARYNATHVAPVEVIRIVGTAIETLNRHDPASSPADVATLMRSILATLDELHGAVEEAWFHSDALSEERGLPPLCPATAVAEVRSARYRARPTAQVWNRDRYVVAQHSPVTRTLKLNTMSCRLRRPMVRTTPTLLRRESARHRG